MALDNLPSPLYVAFQGLETYFVDKDTGFPLSGGYVVFYKDVGDRSATKDVYQQVRLSDNTYQFVNIGHVVNLTAVGTFESPSDGSDIQVYAFPYVGTPDAPGDIELYHLKVYSSGDILQFTRDAQPANVAGSQDIDNFGESDNIIENPQFVKTLLTQSNTLTISVTGANVVNEIAPDWSIVTSGTGTVTISLEDLNDILEPTGAPFALHLSSTGIDSLILRQTITQSPRIVGHSYISASLVAKSFMSNAVPIIMNYTASNGYSVQILNQNTSSSGDYTQLINSSATLIATTNTNPGSTGSVNIDIVIPVGQSIAVTSVQVVSVLNASSNVNFIQISTPRQIDHLFHYYKPQLEYKPIPSYLVGWDFPFNPCQELGRVVAPAAIGANKSRYIADQTILFATVNNVLGASFDSTVDGLNFSTGATTSFAIVQYLGFLEARELLHNAMAVNVAGYASNALSGIINLYWTTDASLPNINGGTNNSLVALVSSAGVPTVGGGGVFGNWTKVGRSNLGDAKFIFPADTTKQSFNFNGWDATADAGIGTATFFAIVISFGDMTAVQQIVLNYAALCSGDIATRPAPQSPDQVLSQCEYYYEKTYPTATAVLPTPPAIAGGAHAFEMLGQVAGGNGEWIARQFDIRFNCEKRALPGITFLSVAGTPNNVSGYLLSNGAPAAGPTDIGIANWAVNNAYNTNSLKGVSYQPVNATVQMVTGGATTFPEGIILAQYVIDARFGIV